MIPKKTMIKDRTGQVRRCAYNLPNDANPAHAFGKEVGKDEEGAGAVISQWVGPKLSKAAKSSRSFVETNRRAVSECKAVDATGFREYARQHPNIRRKPVKAGVVTNAPTIPDHARNQSFGRKTESSDSTMVGLINAHFTNFSREEEDYPDFQGIQKKGRLPMPRATKASRGQDVTRDGCTTNQRVEKAPSTFKMRKFENVGAAVFQ